MTANWFSTPAPVTRRVRAYFAPVNRAAQAPVVFDPAVQGGLSLDTPPAPWIGLGWIQGLARKSASKSAAVMTGIPAAPLEQVRETLAAQVSFEFMSWTKLTMALATGCRNAAQTLAQTAASVSALWSGMYKGPRTSFATDVWPGDALQLNAPSTNLNTQMVVRAVKVSYRATSPDLVEYAIAFANDWADDLAIKTSTTVPADTWLPALVAPTVLANLNGLTVTAMNGSTVTINAGATAPIGGGFEIRRRDNCFMPGEDTDLVLRGSQATMSFARVSMSDRYYIRMYDGATPPNYSEFSAALFFNLPLGS